MPVVMTLRITAVVALLLLIQQPFARWTTAAQETTVDASEPFDQWLGKLIDEARTRGFSDRTINATLSGLEPLPRVIQSDRNQAELNPGFARYLSSHLPQKMLNDGRQMMREHASLLHRLEASYGVPGSIVVAIWGIETHYGHLTGRTPVFRALATLAWEPRRADFFRGELFQALMMVDRGYIDAPSMTGSWAGAMGQTQFMPSSYMEFAVDYDGDGHRDIWRSTPDALASIANYLKGYGWRDDKPWGREVHVPADAQAYIDNYVPKRTLGCYAMRNMTERIPMSIWRDVGVTDVNGAPVPAADVVAGLVDVGERKFLVYPNYDAILGYNCAHYYALSVALLGDTIQGIAPAPRASRDRATASSRRGSAHPPAHPARSTSQSARSRRS